MFAIVQTLPTNTETENVIKGISFPLTQLKTQRFCDYVRDYMYRLFFHLSQQNLGALKTRFEGNYSEIYPW